MVKKEQNHQEESVGMTEEQEGQLEEVEAQEVEEQTAEAVAEQEDQSEEIEATAGEKAEAQEVEEQTAEAVAEQEDLELETVTSVEQLGDQDQMLTEELRRKPQKHQGRRGSARQHHPGDRRLYNGGYRLQV
ncbi:MAG: hypothetical protein P8X67_09780 [Syntrophobacterales bacterium]